MLTNDAHRISHSGDTEVGQSQTNYQLISRLSQLLMTAMGSLESSTSTLYIIIGFHYDYMYWRLVEGETTIIGW